MTFEDKETSVEDGKPVEVFEITSGSLSFHYTSAEDSVTLGAQTYTPVPGLNRSSNAEGPSRREQELKIELPTTDTVSQLFLGTIQGNRTRVVISRFHRTDLPTPEVVQVFDGFIYSAQFSRFGKKATLSAKTALASIGRQGPPLAFQAACNYALYDPLTCKVDDTDPAFRASALTVASLDGVVLTVTSGLSGVYADGWMTGGHIEALGDTDYRLILAHSGNVLTLSFPLRTVPTSVNVFAGCAHNPTICHTKFGNLNNYGGFPFVPNKNIYQTGLL